jgi:hypothetical protein
MSGWSANSPEVTTLRRKSLAGEAPVEMDTLPEREIGDAQRE